MSMFSAFVAYQVSTVDGLPRGSSGCSPRSSAAARSATSSSASRSGRSPVARRSTRSSSRSDGCSSSRRSAGLIWGNTAYHAPVRLAADERLRLPRHDRRRRLGRVHDGRRRARPRVRHGGRPPLDDVRHLDARGRRRPRGGAAVGDQRQPRHGRVVDRRLVDGRDRRRPDHAARSTSTRSRSRSS